MQLERFVCQTCLGDHLEYSVFPSPGQWKGPIVWIYYLDMRDLKKLSVLHVYVCACCFHVQVCMYGYTHACEGWRTISGVGLQVSLTLFPKWVAYWPGAH